MVGTPINAFDDGISRTPELVVEPSGNETADHRLRGVLAMQGEAGDVRLVAGAGHGAMHRLDDVAAD